jgi:hypothetical protein
MTRVALEKSLWARVRDAGKFLARADHLVDLWRLENEIGEGHPDVEGCINGAQVWIELKSEMRPARASTMIRPKVRESQSIWHRRRTKAGSKCHWVLLQVGEASAARLYLIAGCDYDEITATELDLSLLSMCEPHDAMTTVLLCAASGW